MVTASLRTQSVGNEAFGWAEVGVGGVVQTTSQAAPPRQGTASCYYTAWRLISVNAATHVRRYGVFLYNACDQDRQVFPVITSPNMDTCFNDDAMFPSGKPSFCVRFDPQTVPAGLPFDATCMALAETAVGLHADLQPPAYDPTQPAALTATTSFSTDFTSLLSDATCSDVIDWRVTAWQLRWPDGHVDSLPGAGQQGVTQQHTVQPQPGASGPQTADVTAIAHLHITARAVDFDAAGQPFVRTLSGDVVVSNRASATGIGAAPQYTPPTITVAALAAVQNADGTLPSPTGAAAAHADAVRGRLLALLPSALVTTPGSESVGGVVVGTARTQLLGWTYTGPPTDAPSGEGTPPQATGSPGDTVVEQWNHAERIDPGGSPVDELVPLILSVRTVYPDGHVETTTVTGAIAVTIHYAGLDAYQD